MKSHALVGLAVPLAGCVALVGCGAVKPNSVAPDANTVKVNDSNNATPDPNAGKVNTSNSVASDAKVVQASYSGNTDPDANSAKVPDSNSSTPDSNAGPVRLARFVAVKGDIDWRPDDQSSWSQAVANLPVRQGAEISTPNSGRAEIQFDDGTRLWMTRGAVVTLRSLYSDADGEFTEISVRNGVVGLDPRSPRSVYKIDTPCTSVDAVGPSRLRIDATKGVRVCGRQGHVTVEGDNGKATLNSGDSVTLQSAQSAYVVQPAPPPDDVDNWISSRCQHEEQYRHHPDSHYVPDNIALVSDDLDDYGDWRTDPQYGRVWHPRHQEGNWRPYHDGHWTWVAPFGWTWVANEPWGWAPYHYGTWCHASYGWGWVPGPQQQYWSPAAVDFSEDNGNVGWCALAPTEVHYPPTLSVGFRGGDWALSFSIGAAAVYYPTAQGYCEARPWSSHYVNQVTYVNNVTNINNYYGGAMINHNNAFVSRGYIPINARNAAGASLAPAGAFGGRGAYQALPRGANPVFTRGRLIGAPTGSFAAVAGPPAVRLTPAALYPTRSLRQSSPVPQAVLTRSVFHAPGAPGNPAAVHQARTLGAAAGVAAVGVAAHMATHQPAVRPGTPLNNQPGRPQGIAGRAPGSFNAPRPANRPGPVAGRAAAITPAQHAAMQARAALGIKPRAGATPPAANTRGVAQHAVNRPAAPAQPGRTNRSVAAPQVAHVTRPAATSAPHSMPQSRVAANPVHQTTARPSGSFAPQHNQATPRSVAPAQHTTAPERHTAPSAPPHREAVRPTAPPQHVERTAPAVRQAAPPQHVERSAPQRAPSPQHVERSAPQRAPSPPPVQRSAPQRAPGPPPVQRSAPPAPQKRQEPERRG